MIEGLSLATATRIVQRNAKKHGISNFQVIKGMIRRGYSKHDIDVKVKYPVLNQSELSKIESFAKDVAKEAEIICEVFILAQDWFLPNLYRDSKSPPAGQEQLIVVRANPSGFISYPHD